MLDGMLTIAVTGFLLGLAYAAVPGPINTETIRRGVAGGFRPALFVQIGAFVGDLGWATLGLSGAMLLSGSGGVTTTLELTGAAFLLWLGVSAFRARPVAVASGGPGQPVPEAAGRHLLVGVMFSLLNPVGLAFWAGIGAGMMARFSDPTAADIALTLSSFTAGLVVWGAGIAAVVSFGRRRLSLGQFRLVDRLCGLVMVWFGVSLAWGCVGKLPGLVQAIVAWS